MLLIVSKPKIHAEDLSDMMNFMGILSFAATPVEALFEISEKYRALLIIFSETVDDNVMCALSKRARELGVPIFSNDENEGTKESDFYFKKGSSASEMLAALRERCKTHGYKIPGEYKTDKIDLSTSKKNFVCFGNSIPFTKTEAMILRVLLHLAPSPVKGGEILKFAFRNKRLPDESGIRTHISKINKKTQIFSGRTLISNCDKLGYSLLLEDFRP